MRWLRSLAEPSALGELVAGAYGVDVTGCELVRSLVSDVYAIITPAGRFALKVHRHGGRSLEEAAWEQALLAHADAAGAAVAVPVPLTDGRLAGEVGYPEGPRAFAMTAWVEGRKPRPPLTDELYRDVGRAVAAFHTATDGLAGPHGRRRFDVERDLDEPARVVLEHLAGSPSDRAPSDHALVGDLAALARRFLLDLPAQGADWGACHGDVSLDNVHLADRGVVLHDVDRAHVGWRAADTTGVSATPHWPAFVEGYAEVRALQAVDLDAVRWLRVTDLIANLRFHLVVKPQWCGAESRAEGWADRELQGLRELGAELLEPS